MSFRISKGAVIHQADVKNASLDADLQRKSTRHKEELERLQKTAKGRLVSELQKPLYGTEQAHTSSTAFVSLRYGILESDHAVFYKTDVKKYTIVTAATDEF
ncbi:hypothetical protein Hypma_009967 [Hypsizygus marmoreus]|uniref:Uncharacterized protein n=1 Tax=Hypsizygus marmoreus TaxID=39966 RepID=A0A369JQL7_HYPMA|nr:hypothetical protein Hypma_009967 [Hypsizygus marmoreus]